MRMFKKRFGHKIDLSDVPPRDMTAEKTNGIPERDVAILEELGERRVRKLLSEQDGPLLDYSGALMAFRIQRARWNPLKRAAWNLGFHSVDSGRDI